MYNINFLQLIIDNLPTDVDRPRVKDWLLACMKGIRDLNVQLVALEQQLRYDLTFNGHVIYLEHVLNDQFDNALRRIFIQDAANVQFDYLFNLIEAQPPLYSYNNWNAATVYNVGDFVAFGISGVGTHVFEALTNNSNKQPDTNPTDWVDRGDVPLQLLNQVEYTTSQFDFIVWIPNVLFVTLDANQVNALINKYKVAGKRHVIMTF